MTVALHIAAAYFVIGGALLLLSMRTRTRPNWKVAALFVAVWPAVAVSWGRELWRARS